MKKHGRLIKYIRQRWGHKDVQPTDIVLPPLPMVRQMSFAAAKIMAERERNNRNIGG